MKLVGTLRSESDVTVFAIPTERELQQIMGEIFRREYAVSSGVEREEIRIWIRQSKAKVNHVDESG